MTSITDAHLSKERELILEKWISNKMSEQELRSFYLEVFLSMRDDWLDELPNVDVYELAIISENGNGFISGHNYKCRGNYICGLFRSIDVAIERKVITDLDIIQKYELLKKHDFEFHKGEFTTKEEIDMLNDILNDIIEYLQKIEKKDLIELLSGLIFVKKISFIDNYICILFKKTFRGRWIKIFIKEIKISFLKNSGYIFIHLESKNLLLEKIFRKLDKKMYNKIQFSIKQQDKCKFGYRYVITITRPNGSDYIKEKYPKIAEFFTVDSCSEITWNIEGSKIKFNIK